MVQGTGGNARHDYLRLGRLRHVVGALTTAALIIGCHRTDFAPALDVRISPTVGVMRSPPFEIDQSCDFWIGIGIEGMPVDETTCLATVDEGARRLLPSCRAITPAIGAFTWKVTHQGQVVAEGSESGLPSVPYQPNNLGKITPENIQWQFFHGFFARARKDDVAELNLQPSPISLDPYHPRLAIVLDAKGACSD